METKNEFYGKEIILIGEVKYIGKGEDPKDNLGFQMWERALKKAFEQIEKGE